MVDMTEVLPDPNDLLSSKSVPSLSFKDAPVGTAYTGIITDLRTVQVRNFDDPNKLEFWDDGKPKLQIEVTLATDYIDDSIEEDDGTRRVYLFGQKLSAAKAEMKAKGFDKLEKGFEFTITFIGEKPATNKRYNPIKQYAIELKAGKSNPDVDAVLAAVGAEKITKPKAATGDKLTKEQDTKARKMLDAGFNVEEIAEVLGVNKYLIEALETF